ncbi:hypothetical protein ACNY9Y_004319 [Cronobacter dublinensis]
MTLDYPHIVVIKGTQCRTRWNSTSGEMQIAVRDDSYRLNLGDIVDVLIGGESGKIQKFKITTPPSFGAGAFREKGAKYRLKFTVAEVGE